MDNSPMKKLLPHILAFGIMMAASFIFFLPYFQGKVLTQSDNVRAKAMQAEMRKIGKTEGIFPLWTNSMFGGMPTYQIMATAKGNQIRHFFKASLFGQGITSPHFVILVAMLCCYLFLITLGVDWRIGVIGAIGFGLSNYFIDLAEAGHSTKMIALAYVPGVMTGAIQAFRGRYLMGGAMFAFFLSLNIYSNHYQITFYMMLLLAILGLVELIKAVKHQTFPSFGKAAGVLIIATLLAVATNLSRIWPTQEYAKETIRGKSALKANAGKEGLTKDYIFGWSYGKMESFTLLVPNFNGGGTSQHFRGTETHKKLYSNVERSISQQGGSRQAAKKSAEAYVASLFYWGNQPGVGVAIYFGAIILLLFFLGAFLVKGAIKQWLVASAIFSLTLAWGGNFFLNSILVDYVPMFNKFRAVSMALGLTHLAVVVLAMLGLNKLMDVDVSKEKKLKALYIAAGITGGLCVLAMLIGGFLDMTNPRDASRISQIGQQIVDGLPADRLSVLRSDAIRSLALILVSAGIIWAYLQGKLKALIMVGLVGLFCLGDVWLINKRILFAEKYETPREVSQPAQPRPVDLQIQKDPDIHYRVLDQSAGNPYTNATPSYFHKSIGGYHAAKLIRFQELAERYFYSPGASFTKLLGMLNTKYIIQQGQNGALQPSRNPDVMGNAWFVDSYQVVADADAELNGLGTLNPANQALIEKNYAQQVEGFTIQADPTASIKLTSYHPDHMVYEYSAASDQLAVFSEMYYSPERGWNTYIDGQLAGPFTKANYILRAMKLPAGKNKKLEMKFEPRSFVLGETISLISSILLILGFFGSMFLFFKSKGVPEVNLLHDMTVEPPKKIVKTKSKIKKRGKS